MPPVNQQGSKAGLITALVITVILLMVTLIMSITANTNLTKQKNDYDKLKGLYEKIAKTDQLVADTGEVAMIDVAKEKLNLDAGSTTVEVALAEIRKLTQDITGTPTPAYGDADAKAADAVNAAMAVLKNPTGPAPTSAPAGSAAPMPAGGLVGVIELLQKKLTETANTDAKKKLELDKLSKSLEERVSGWNTQFAELKTKGDEAEKRAADAEKSKADLQAQYMTKQTTADDSNKTTVDATGKQLTDMQTIVAQAKAETSKVAKENDSLKAQLANFRLDVKDAAIRHADGTIIRVPSNAVCYISIGSGDHLPAGTTFEVYDKNEGIPGLGKDPLSNTNLPIGKASIEVIRVGQNSSECRIVHLQPGVTLSEGDIIGNLVYNTDTTFNFFVYGNFDVDGNGVYTAQEADVVRSLVTRWGGKLSDKIAVSTDFVVLGQEPQVPILTKEERDDPILIDKLNKAIEASKKYQDVINQAATLHIPIMNQNRFMYYIGYYDQMKR